ncbi:MAG: aminotransferase class III-fold pyridoxal phosphate-dependent enzyme [Phycisphaerales bacterium]|jgi:taurine--2-oxoglutarate transaminase|nr:aminotransferase class III-fold pyridoxal phosphate-dependent enzyme [Planctomycetota bacterium]
MNPPPPPSSHALDAPPSGMGSEEMIRACLEHSMFSWSATGKVAPVPVARAEGIHLYSPEGKRWIDFNSQLMSVNIGHGHPRVVKAIQDQAATLAYAFPGIATEIRARLSLKLAEIVPGNINSFFYTLGGAEANENAIKAARLYTGRHKILVRHRAYHGGTHGAITLTGDPRRWPAEPGMPGVVRTMDPRPYEFSFGSTDAEIVENNLRYLEETIAYEGPQNIAAMFIETVTGTNGILPPPEGYLKGLKALLAKHGILLVCDEVMCGFGRTGRLFAFEHGGIVPDIVTMAKGLTSSYLPLGVMALSDPIADHFRENVFWGGLTYNAHPLCLAAALAAIEVLLDEGMIENSARMGDVMRGHMERLAAKHRCVKEHRNIGLFGTIELQKNTRGERLVPYAGSHPVMPKLGAFLKENGLFTVLQWNLVMCNPPLCIDEAQMAEAFEIIDRGLDLVDEVVED